MVIRRKKRRPANQNGQPATAEEILASLRRNDPRISAEAHKQAAQAEYEKIKAHFGTLSGRASRLKSRQRYLTDQAQSAQPGELAALAAEYASLEGERRFYEEAAQEYQLQEREAFRKMDLASQNVARLENHDSKASMAEKLRHIIRSYQPVNNPKTGAATYPLPMRELNKLQKALDELTKPVKWEVWPPPADQAEERKREQERRDREQRARIQAEAEALRRELEESGQLDPDPLKVMR